MKRTYYIVKTRTNHNEPAWNVYKRGLLSTFNIFNVINQLMWVDSYNNPEECEYKLREYINLRKQSREFKPKIVRVVKI